MFSAKSVSLTKKREGILGQFSKAITNLIKLNEEIDAASVQCSQRQEGLRAQLEQEDNEAIELHTQKTANEKTIKKMQEFLI